MKILTKDQIRKKDSTYDVWPSKYTCKYLLQLDIIYYLILLRWRR